MPETVLADTGYANGDAVTTLQSKGIEVLVATRGDNHRRAQDLRPAPAVKPEKPQEVQAQWIKDHEDSSPERR